MYGLSDGDEKALAVWGECFNSCIILGHITTLVVSPRDNVQNLAVDEWVGGGVFLCY